MHPKTLLFVLIGAVPPLVAVAGAVSLLLLRAGHGLVVGLFVPLLALFSIVAILGAVLGRAASNPGRDRHRGRDGV
jgi:hypothetical protein